MRRFLPAFVLLAACGSSPPTPATWNEIALPSSKSTVFVWLVGDSLYLGASDQHTYRTSDIGTTWDTLPFNWIGASYDGQTIYANVPLQASQKSTDGGQTWTNNPTPLAVYSVGVDRNVVYGLVSGYTQSGDPTVFPSRSINGGATTTTLPGPAVDFMADPFVGARVYLVDQQGDQIAYDRSDDMGQTSTAISFAEGLMRVDPGVKDALWRFHGNAIDHSTDAGTTWTPVTTASSVVQDLVPMGDDTALAFTSDHAISRVSLDGEWTNIGTSPGDVGRAHIGKTPGTVVVTSSEFDPQHIYMTQNLDD